MEVRNESITPQKAEQYLNRNTSNRKLRDGVVERYASDMKQGRWTECPAPIVFYENGDVADGQHRLWAIVESKTTQKFLVGRGLSREAGLNIDTGVTRNLVDNARIAGLNDALTSELLACARAVDEGVRGTKGYSNAQKLAMFEKHKESVTWACQHGPRGRTIRNQCVLSAVARAWMYEADKEKLQRFCKVLSTGVPDGEHESAAIALRNYLLVKRNAHLNQMFAETFKKVQNAIHYFMRDKKLMVIKVVADEQYPLKKGR
jgi:hypothetical protein